MRHFQNQWLKVKIIVIKTGNEDIKIRKPYNRVQVASKKVAKHNNFILENFFIKIGTNGVSIVPAIE